MTSDRSGPRSPHPRSGEQKQRKPDLVGSHPMDVLKGIASEATVGGQIGVMSPAGVAQVIVAIDAFNRMVGLPELYPHLTAETQRRVDQICALKR